MSDQNWNEMAIVTARIEILSGERTTARCMGNAQAREQFNTEIGVLLHRRKRLIDRLSICHAAPSAALLHRNP